MSFYTRYELERLLADGEAKTFRAIESATGRIVFLHLFSPRGQGLLAELKAKLVGPGGKPAPPLVEIGEFAGSQYAVTEGREPFSGLREWLDRQPEAALPPGPALPRRAPEPGPSVPPAASKPPALLDDEPGEFTRLFPPSEPAAQPAEPVRPPAASQPPALLDDEPGEFTKLFARSEPAVQPAEPVRPPAASKPPALLDDASGEFHRQSQPSRPGETTPARAAAEEAGDFTRAFGPAPPESSGGAKPPVRLAPTPPSPPPVPQRREVESPSAPAEWVPADTGEFTKLFGSGLSGEAIDIAGEQARAARSAADESRPFRKAGEFTRIFGPGMGGEALAGPAPSASNSLNTASGLFGSSDDAAKPAQDALNAPRQPEQKSDPGEYTRIFGEKPEAPKPPEAAKPAAVALAAPKPKMQPAVIAVIVAAIVVLVALIVVAVVLSLR
ncbi:MAG: hypothetical protein ACLPX8_12285 [Bryobacteraceae bacterium]|jgi:hypothetical protein